MVAAIGIIAWMSYAGNTYQTSSNSNLYPTSTNQTSNSTSQSELSVLSLSSAVDPNLGSYLVGPNGLALYVYAKDKANTSNCTGSCTKIWLPYTVSTSTTLTGSTDVNGTISTITRNDNTLQVTYNSAPLYYYSGDKNPGDVMGQGVGGVWSLAKP